MAEVLRACVIAKSGRIRRPFGWGCSRKHRKIAEATHAAYSCTLGNRVPVLAGGEPKSFGSSPASSAWVCLNHCRERRETFMGKGFRQPSKVRYSASDSAIDNASCAPSRMARQHSISQAAMPSGVPAAKPSAASR
jgi:hypothetical protein